MEKLTSNAAFAHSPLL